MMMSKSIKSNCSKLVSYYTRFFPLDKGKPLLEKYARKFFLDGNEYIVDIPDIGRIKLKFPEDQGFERIFFRKKYEEWTTKIIQKTLKKDSVFFDIGSNIGWYSLKGINIVYTGKVHSFEPIPDLFTRLKDNIDLNCGNNRCILNNFALGEKTGLASIHLLNNKPHGHSTICTNDYTTKSLCVNVQTLDEYVQKKGIKNIDLIKLDVEGSELSVLKGAMSIFSFKKPPIWIIEFNDDAAKNFRYECSDILSIFDNIGTYVYYRIPKGWSKPIEMRNIRDYCSGDNILIMPKERYEGF